LNQLKENLRRRQWFGLFSSGEGHGGLLAYGGGDGIWSSHIGEDSD